ncbi:hypothetical protein Bbelb_070290 [Branchiostoma belcheri]|nr:hypothetical protein Bbelb_070290 [Branchiostoma belcheri]
MATTSPDNGTVRHLLLLTASASADEVYEAYSAFVQEYTKEQEYVKKLSLAERKTYQHKISGKQFTEVSAAFLSSMEDHRNKIPNCKIPNKISNSVTHNVCSLTIQIPENTLSSWKSVCASYYGVQGKDRGTNGMQFSATFTDSVHQIERELGSIHITVYNTCKILIQGSCYVLWLCSHYDHLQDLVLADVAEKQPNKIDSSKTNQVTKCAVCLKNEKDGDEFVGCNDCLSWTHFECTGLNEEMKFKLKNTDEMFHCINCTIPQNTKRSLEQSHSSPPPRRINCTVPQNTEPPFEQRQSSPPPRRFQEDKNGKQSTSTMNVQGRQLVQNNENTETLKTALLDLEASLAQLKLQSNTFESKVSNQLDIIFKRLDSSCSPVKQDTEFKKLKEDNKKLQEENNTLCKRVKHLEELVFSLQTESANFQSDLSAVKSSHSTLKVKVSNMKEIMLDNAMANNKHESPKQSTLLKYAVATSNRFEPLLATPSLNSSDEVGLETDPKALIRSLTNGKKTDNPRPRSSRSNSKSKRLVLIGDSNAEKLKPDLLSPTADIPKPTWAPTLSDTLTALEKMSEEEPTPNTVVFHVGTNDVMSKPKEAVINDFETVISTTQSLFPSAEVVISAVPPRRDTNQRANVKEDIISINRHLKNTCDANTALTFVDHPQLWLDRDYNAKMFARDGYHLNNDGVRVMAYNLKKQATAPLGLQPTKQGKHRRTGNQAPVPYNNDKRRSTPRSTPPNRGRQTTSRQGYEQDNSFREPRPTPYLPKPPPFHGPVPGAMGPFYPPPIPWSSEWPSVMEAYGDSYRFNPNPMWARPPLYPPYNRDWIRTSFGPSDRPHGFK